jgi:DNA-binding transcriptional MerR regulator
MFYSMREVSSLLGVAPQTIRYWEKRARIRIYRSGQDRGRRLYREADIARLARIASLVREGYRIDGARHRIGKPDGNIPALGTKTALTGIREELVKLMDRLETLETGEGT